MLNSLSRRTWMIPSFILTAMILAAAFAPWITPQNPYALDKIELADSYLAPSWLRNNAPEASPASRYWLGTDSQGRDIYSALFYGLRVSLMVGIGGTLLALIAGVALGLLAGYHGGRFDAAIMRLADIQLSFPSVLIALFLMAIWGQGVGKIIIAVGLVHWVIYARVVRGDVLAEREKDYISAIEALGARTPRILIRHLLPNLTGPIIVVSAVQFASIVMLEATLSYLGVGVPITRPSLGMLIKFGYDDFFSGHWWVWFFPGLVLVALVVAINWLADDLRHQFSVKD
ncbi:ABC transporter permease [Candidatus Sumerlaeota bacterium]|nr:ABC transporter permease [Candidatus Sumerlaeota bacterium]